MFPGHDNPTPEKPVACGRYELIERIGFGGMAEVFKARLPGPDGFQKIVVIKRILPRLTNDKLMVRMFIEEAKIAAAADHDNIAKVFELGRSVDGKYFMVMEYIAGIDIELLLKSAAKRSLKMPAWFSLYAVSEVLEALDFVHNLTDEQGEPRNVIHRDVTPSNIFASFLGKVKLSDFGVADFAGKTPTTQAGQLKGKLAYMSPEQLSGELLDQRTDVFSMGVVLWEMLTQQRLFGSLNDMQAMMAICESKRKPPSEVVSDIPPELDRCVLRALAADRNARYQTAADFQTQLLSVLHDMRPAVRSADAGQVVRVLLGREEPTADTSPKLAMPDDLESSFLVSIDDDLRASLEEPEEPSGPLVAPVSSAVASVDDTVVHGMAAYKEAETLDEDATPALGAEAKRLRSIIAAQEASGPSAIARPPPPGPPPPPPADEGDEEEEDDEYDLLSEDSTLPLEPINNFNQLRISRTRSHTPRVQIIPMSEQGGELQSKLAFWIRKRGDVRASCHSYEEAYTKLKEAGQEGTSMAISADSRQWLDVDEFGQLSGQDIILDISAPPSNVTVVGSLEQRSIAAVFGIIARDKSTGTLTIAHTEEDSEEWYELQVVNGQPNRVVTNVESMQMPRMALDRTNLTPQQLVELLSAVVKERRPLEQVARARNFPCIDRRAFLRERMTALFAWKAADYTFNLDFTRNQEQPPFARSLLGLLPDLIFGAHDLQSLRALMKRKMSSAFEPSWRLEDEIEELELSAEDRRLVFRLSAKVPLRQLIEETPQSEHRLLALAYAFFEADLLLEVLN